MAHDMPADFPQPDRLMSSVMSMAQEAVDRVEVLSTALRLIMDDPRTPAWIKDRARCALKVNL